MQNNKSLEGNVVQIMKIVHYNKGLYVKVQVQVQHIDHLKTH